MRDAPLLLGRRRSREPRSVPAIRRAPKPMLVDAPGGDYLLSLIARRLADTGCVVENEGHRLVREVPRTVFRHFDPDVQAGPGSRSVGE